MYLIHIAGLKMSQMEKVSGTWLLNHLLAKQFPFEAINDIFVLGVSCRRRVIIIQLIVVCQQSHPQVARVLNNVLHQSEDETAKN